MPLDVPTLDPAEVERVRRQLDAGWALPASWYYSDQIFQLERRRYFRSSWWYFGHESLVPDPRSYATETVGTMPVLVTRDDDGALHAFFNVCTHRMHEVATGCGKASGLVCRYHGWRFRHDGSLAQMPRSAEVFDGDANGLSMDCFALQRLQIANWNGLLFVNADPDAEPFEQQMGDVLAAAEQAQVPRDVVCRYRWAETVDANWKTLVDNVIECYHCTLVHPQLAVRYDTSAAGTTLRDFRFGAGVELAPREVDPSGPVPDGNKNFFLQPVTWLGVKANRWLLMVLVEPLTARTAKMVTEILVPPDMSEEEAEAIHAGARIVNEQDIAVSVSAQRGYELDPDFQAYQFPHTERSLRRFARAVFDAVTS